MTEHEDEPIPEWADMRIESERGEVGIKRVVITATKQAAEIDLEMELPRIQKLLERDYKSEEEDV